MALTHEEIKLAYMLLLNREPNEAEIEHTAENHEGLASIRTAFLRSEEFHQQYDTMRKNMDKEQPPTLIHIHIPKTAGTTLAQALEKEPKLQPNMIVSDPEIDKVLAMPRRARRDLRYIRGHLSMGFGERLGIPFRYMTVLRRPGRRIFSFYQFIQRTTSHPLHGYLTHHQLDFGAFLEHCASDPSLRLEIDNGQVRRLSGLLDRPTFGQETQLLREAVHNALAPNMLIGFSENFEAFAQLLVDEGYLTSPDLERFNSSPNSDAFDAACEAFTENQHALFENFTMWDDYLYDVCEALLAL